MPISASFSDRLFPLLEQIANHFGTPFHIYDELGIRQTCEKLKKAFSPLSQFREYFAVKALPNPKILEIMQDMNFGFDCSSIPEILLTRQIGAKSEDIMFTSNNTSELEFKTAEADGGAILNLDDISLIEKIPNMPELICFRYNPGPERTGNQIIGNPEEAKYGLTRHQIIDAYKSARQRGAKRFGLHTMLASNELDYNYIVETAGMLLDLAQWINQELGIIFEFINIGGGLGIPYRPDEKPFDLDAMAKQIITLFMQFEKKNSYLPRLYMESGRYMTGPSGVLITRAINKKEIYRKYIGVDACMSSLMRPGIYGSYHHISVPGKNSDQNPVIVDVVGSLCENNDKFAIQRPLPKISIGDILCIHDTGAHGHAMGFNYNGRLRPKELLLRQNGSVELIRREETIADYFAALEFKSDILFSEHSF